jgi:hypothetical protein
MDQPQHVGAHRSGLVLPHYHPRDPSVHHQVTPPSTYFVSECTGKDCLRACACTRRLTRCLPCRDGVFKGATTSKMRAHALTQTICLNQCLHAWPATHFGVESAWSHLILASGVWRVVCGVWRVGFASRRIGPAAALETCMSSHRHTPSHATSISTYVQCAYMLANTDNTDCSGIIIDGFGELRDKENEAKEYREETCVVCGVGRQTMEQVCLSVH